MEIYKENKGARSFLTRGLKTVKSEFNLICAACNIKRTWGLLLEGKQKKKISSTELTQQNWIFFIQDSLHI